MDYAKNHEHNFLENAMCFLWLFYLLPYNLSLYQIFLVLFYLNSTRPALFCHFPFITYYFLFLIYNVNFFLLISTIFFNFQQFIFHNLHNLISFFLSFFQQDFLFISITFKPLNLFMYA